MKRCGGRLRIWLGLVGCGSVLLLKTLPQAALAQYSGLSSQVQQSTDGRYRYIKSNGIPDHAPGNFPNPGNPNRVRSQTHAFRIPLQPQVAVTPHRDMRYLFGVALNGVVFDPGTGEFWNRDRRSGWNYEALSGRINLGLDTHNAHVQPDGTYHYHGLPSGLVATLRRSGKMVLLGYAADGFPIYSGYGHENPNDLSSPLRQLQSSYRLKPGQRPDGPGGRYDGTFVQDYEYVAGLGDLDECNGRLSKTPDYPQGVYHYLITEMFPFIGRCFRGTPDPSFYVQRPTPGQAGGPKPRSGVGRQEPPSGRFPHPPYPPRSHPPHPNHHHPGHRPHPRHRFR